MRINHTAKRVVLIVMTLVSLTNLVGVSAAGISVGLGIGAYFYFKRFGNLAMDESDLNVRTIRDAGKKPGIWLWVFMPSIMNIMVIFLAKFILPNYIDHIVARSEGMLSVSILPMLIVQLLFFALGEEIAWRGFYQKQLQSFVPIGPAIAVTSAIFSLGHLTSGSAVIVAYDLLFVFVNSMIYGNIFRKTNHLWLSTVSHFTANLTAVIILFFL